MLWSLNSGMNGHHHEYFSDACHNYYMSQCRGNQLYQVQSKIGGTEILLISETWF